MSFMFYVARKGKAKIYFAGNAVNILTAATVVCKTTAERIAKEKNITMNEAMNFVMQNVVESQDLFTTEG